MEQKFLIQTEDGITAKELDKMIQEKNGFNPIFPYVDDITEEFEESEESEDCINKKQECFLKRIQDFFNTEFEKGELNDKETIKENFIEELKDL